MWFRGGDTLTTHPLMIRLLEVCGGDHLLKNEAKGVFADLVSISAAHATDYWVGYGAVSQIAPGREKIVIENLCAAGLLFREEGPEGRPMLRIVDDPTLYHIRLKEEMEIDRRRAKDKQNPELLITVRVRDGDQCRWCKKTVDWRDRRSARGATYDSLNGHKESTPETLVVACRGCNSKRGAGVVLELQDPPTPEEVYYTAASLEFINSSQYAQDNGIHVISRKERQAQHAAAQGNHAPARQTPAKHKNKSAVTEVVTSAPEPTPPVAADGFSDPLDDAPDWVREGHIETPPTDIAGSSPAQTEVTPPQRAQESTQHLEEETAAMSCPDAAPGSAQDDHHGARPITAQRITAGLEHGRRHRRRRRNRRRGGRQRE